MSWYFWLILGVVLLLGSVVYNGFRTRCPSCGVFALHPLNKEAEVQGRENYRNAQNLGFNEALPELFREPGYATRNLFCKGCGHPFNRKEALIWLTAANKIGEEKALREYKKMKQEFGERKE